MGASPKEFGDFPNAALPGIMLMNVNGKKGLEHSFTELIGIVEKFASMDI